MPGAPRLALMGHLDVVPANPEGWSVDPGGVVEDGFVWGRGAVDMLNLTAAMAACSAPTAAVTSTRCRATSSFWQ